MSMRQHSGIAELRTKDMQLRKTTWRFAFKTVSACRAMKWLHCVCTGALRTRETQMLNITWDFAWRKESEWRRTGPVPTVFTDKQQSKGMQLR
mmetsp:Transcript_34348/g.84242  ORF Transcript_34348/g.84242 Transcript_34348/m.84242 type:complete len:93 (+) Transcript_34348:40-318(+)